MITTHVLDTSKGRPAASIPVVLEHAGSVIARGTTDADGRLKLAEPPAAGDYRLTFETKLHQPDGFYPAVTIVFTVRDPKQHHHVPLLLSPFGYSTYRGS